MSQAIPIINQSIPIVDEVLTTSYSFDERSAPLYIIAFHDTDRVRTVATVKDQDAVYDQISSRWAKVLVEVPVKGSRRVVKTYGGGQWVKICESVALSAPFGQARLMIAFHQVDRVRMAAATTQADAESVYDQIASDWAKVLMGIPANKVLKTYGEARYVQMCQDAVCARPVRYKVAFHEVDTVRIMSTLLRGDADSAFNQVSPKWAKVLMELSASSQTLNAAGGNQWIDKCQIAVNEKPLAEIKFMVAFHQVDHVRLLGAYNQADAQSMYSQISQNWAKVLMAVPSKQVVSTFGGANWIEMCKTAVTMQVDERYGLIML